MDSERFDTLVKTLFTPATRRGLVRRLTALPLGLTLASLLGDAPDAAAKDGARGSSHRRHRRKAKHRHQTGNNKEHRTGERTGCKPKSNAKTCAGKCGTVRTTCGTPVECGSCACDPPCGACLTCNPATGACVVDATQVGAACGNPGQVCLSNGACGCSPTCGACCSEMCCDPLPGCNASGGCTRCDELCPDDRLFCVHMADGSSTRCVNGIATVCDPCSSSTDCTFADYSECVLGFTVRSTNKSNQICGRPIGTGVCILLLP
jgi:hypothetical protein